MVTPGSFCDGGWCVGGGDGPETYVAFVGAAAEFEYEGEFSTEVGEVLAEAVEVGGVLVGTVGGAVVAVCEGGEEEVWHVDGEGVLGGVALGEGGDGGGDGSGRYALEGGGWVGGSGAVGIYA